jgi:hypothetical protein
MVEIYRALRAFLLADATIAAAVGTRIYPQKLPQAVTYPAITILRVSAPRANVLKGKASLARPRYQIDCWVRETTGATAFTVAQDLGGAVRSRLEGYNGVMTDPTTSPPTDYQTGVTFDDERDLFDPDVNGGYFRWSGDFFVWHGVHPVSA